MSDQSSTSEPATGTNPDGHDPALNTAGVFGDKPPETPAKPETAAEKKKREARERESAKTPAPPGPLVPPAGMPDTRNANPLAGLTEGRIVHFVLESPKDKTVTFHRAAIVSRVANLKKGTADLHVFIPRSDFPKNLNPGSVLMVENVEYDNGDKAVGTWHFPEHAK